MKKFKNTKKESFLASIPTASIEDKNDLLTNRCKFNFHYLDLSQHPPGKKYEEWTKQQLVDFLNKLKRFCESPLSYWKSQFIGGGGKKSKKKRFKVFEIYDKFPPESDFDHPKSVPYQARWARFRLEGDARLVGFVLPDDYDCRKHPGTKKRYDCNTFYVVFLDREHNFWK